MLARITQGGDVPLRFDEREEQVLELMCQGDTDSEISYKLMWCERTIKSHVQAILVRYGARNRTEAAVRGLREGYGRKVAIRNFDEMSKRESEVTQLAALGKKNREIAAELAISVTTVNTHICRLLRKFRARNRTELAVCYTVYLMSRNE